jgi:hypothetical protein
MRVLAWIVSLATVSSVLAAKSAGQIPIREGVIGGVTTTRSTTVKEETLQPLATTPGALRVVENSGICGL